MAIHIDLCRCITLVLLFSLSTQNSYSMRTYYMRILLLFTMFITYQVSADVPDYTVWQCQNESKNNTEKKPKILATSTKVWDCEGIAGDKKIN